MISLLLCVFLVSWSLTFAVRSFALHHHVIDVPNARSSHRVATPRGGGVAFVVTSFAALLWLNAVGVLSLADGAVIFLGGGAVALLGFLDDWGHVSPLSRLLVQSAVSIWVLCVWHAFPTLVFYDVHLPLGFWANCFGFLYFVWLINLYNFMDGIDGLAASEAIFCCLGAAVLYYLHGDHQLTALVSVLAAAVLGFLGWNVSPARIFMGDAGSGFLGFMLALLSIQATIIDAQYFWAWLILLGVFVVDATLTLFRRIIRLENVTLAHAMHGYQHAARRYASHPKVVVVITMINIVWLWPLAWFVVMKQFNGLLMLMLAYCPLIGLALYCKAGHAVTDS